MLHLRPKRAKVLAFCAALRLWMRIEAMDENSAIIDVSLLQTPNFRFAEYKFSFEGVFGWSFNLGLLKNLKFRNIQHQPPDHSEKAWFHCWVQRCFL
jgi:hypothetical protein